MVEGFNLGFLDGVFGDLHKAVDLLNVNVFDVVAPSLGNLLNNFGRHTKLVNNMVCTKI